MNKKIGIGIFVLIIAALLYVYFTTDLLSVEKLRLFIEGFGVWAPVAFGVLYFLLTIFLVPASLFTVLSGLLFGKFVGWLVVIVAATLAAMTAFSISRYFGQDVAEKMAKGKLSKWVDKIEKNVEKNGFQTFFILRCLFLPYMLLSYAAGMVRSAKLWDFSWATLITNGIFSFVFVFLGDSLSQGWLAVGVALGMIVLALSVPRVVKKFTKVNV